MINITMLCANRPRLLKQALDSIGDLSDATVTIRDAFINPEVYGVAHDWVNNRPRSCLFLPAITESLGTGPARNQVVYVSEESFGRGSHLYISDDDVYFLRPDWLEQLVYAYEAAWKEGYRVLGAYNHPYHQPVSWFNFDPKMKVYEVWSLASQSMLMRWDVWDEFGPFDETPAGKVCQGEDVSFGNRIREAGYKLGVISPALLVNCGITNSFGEKIPGWEMVQKECPAGVLCE